MQPSSNIAPPCLVLAVGAQSELIALDAQKLYLRSDPWRAGTARFLALRFSQAANSLRATCVPLKATRARKANPITRQQIYTATLQASIELRSALETALHDLRAHENSLLSAQISKQTGEKRAFALKVLLLTDLTRPESAAVLPLMALLEDGLTREVDKQMLLLAQIARFSEGKEALQQNACCHAGLADLKAVCSSPKNQFQENLARDLELPGLAFPTSFSIFLFDRFKEGGWEVTDEAELRLLNANFLLALLTTGVAAQAEAAAWHSAAATALVYDPGALIETCAARFGLEFIQREFGEDAIPDLSSEQVFTELSALYGNGRGSPGSGIITPAVKRSAAGSGWLETLTSGTGFNAGAGASPALETHFADLSFDDLPPEEWNCAIHGYDTHFGQVVFPSALEKLHTNAQTLAGRLSKEQAEGLDSLPRQGRLYPGGLAASQKIIAELRQILHSRSRQFTAWDAKALTQESLDQRVEMSLHFLEQALEVLPQAPRWFSLLPFSFDRLAKHLFAWLYLRKEHAHLVLLRQQAVLALESKYAAGLEKEVCQALGALCQRLLAEMDEIDQAMQGFQDEVKNARARLEKHIGQEAVGSVFRPSGVDEAVLAWAAKEFQKPVEEIRYLLFDEHDFLYYWRDMDGHNLETGLLDFGRSMYQPLWAYNLDQILSHRADADLTPKDLGMISPNDIGTLSPKGLGMIWAALADGTVPLLRPDFDIYPANLFEQTDDTDAAGAAPQTFQTRHFVCASSRNTVFAPFLRQPLAEWELVSSGDPSVTMCVRIRHGISWAALSHVWERGRLDFEKLSENGNSGLALFTVDTQPPDKE